MVQRGCTSVARSLAALKNETALLYVNGLDTGLVDFAGAVSTTGLPINSVKETKTTVLNLSFSITRAEVNPRRPRSICCGGGARLWGVFVAPGPPAFSSWPF